MPQLHPLDTEKRCETALGGFATAKVYTKQSDRGSAM